MLRLLQRGTFSGWPVGDDAFISLLERQLGRILKAHPWTPEPWRRRQGVHSEPRATTAHA